MAGQERIALLEGRVAELSQVFEGMQAQLRGFEERTDRRFEGIDRRFDAIDRRFDDVNRRVDTLDAKVTRFFMWAVGVQVMMWTAVVGAILAR